jgi:ComF family protein
VLNRLDQLGSAVADFFFPQFCIGCRTGGKVFCPTCLAKLPRLSPPFCLRCSLPQTDNTPCRNCAGLAMAIDGIRSPLTFQKLTREAVHQFKYQNIRTLAMPLASVIHAYLNEHPIIADVLVPVPLHPRRMRERGYNQSFLLARELSKLTDMPVVHSCLKRSINTPAQARTTGSSERHFNMRGAFSLANGKLKGKKVLLIDDVLTSGATLDACALVLKQAGVLSVWGLTVAREI